MIATQFYHRNEPWTLEPLAKTLNFTGMDYSYIAVERRPAGFRIARYSCYNAPEGKAEIEQAQAATSNTTVLLRMRVLNGALCDFSFSSDGGNFVAIGPRFKAREGKWVGAKAGVFCLGAGRETKGHADFDWFRLEP